MEKIDTILLDTIRIDGGTQSRAALNEATIGEYAEAIRGGVDLPPIITFFDGANYWLADGFHRYHAHKAAGAMEIMAEVRNGLCRDAVLYSVGANASHGLRRTNEDKHRAVKTLLGDAEWAAWSQEKIAKACGVSTGFVSKLVNEPSLHGEGMSKPATRTVERNGKVYEQNTANIGKAKPVDEQVPQSIEIKQSATLPEVVPENFGPSPEEIAFAVRAEAEQMDYIKSLLASDDDPLAKTLAELKQKGLEISALRSQNAGHQNTINDQIRMIKSLRSKLEKLERAA
ncbi:hypothetical protein [Glaciimonas immobilis]|uniref:ParB-like chromosome segregation protein Spo0J n=1 Tax=Glaciimonas immobilis TaxID=728004 RepID=A0A840RPI2_9BURK|nr:hypothetical protein [Glaciimonas immobilis]KAF3999182.1 hypothetical protein HAV38_04390 [Glaciimonas immobilis]MBB5198634.1 ParB-like chromosome segregation protein Spo0J [Glaciimonas immobilis]